VEILFIRVILGKHQVVVSGKDFATTKKRKKFIVFGDEIIKILV